MNQNILIYYALSFHAIVKAGSFSKAAKSIGISKAQLSRHVSALENLLGIQLLYRTTRVMALTEQGKQFFAACEKIEESSVEAVSQLKQDFSQMEGTLKVTAPIDFGIQFLSPVIQQFSKQCPKINVIISLSNSNENLIEQNYDLAIRIANQLPDSSLKVRALMKFKRIICIAPHYFKNSKKPKHPDELVNYPCITSVNRNNNNIYPQWAFMVNHKIKNYKLERYVEVDSLFLQRALIKSGLGIGRLPDYFIKNELKNGELIELFSKITKPFSYIYLLYPNSIALPQKTRIFIDLISSHIQSGKFF